MTFTRHGHQILGTTAEARPPGQNIARCGGPGLCGPCSIDAESARNNLHVTTEHESGESHSDLALRIVKDWAVEGLGVPEETGFYVVWYCFILGGWKALISSTEADGRYYEITYNKNKGEAYVDTYKKTHNHAVTIN